MFYSIPEGIVRLIALFEHSINNKINIPQTMNIHLDQRYLELEFEANGASSHVFSTKDSVFKIYKNNIDRNNEAEVLSTLCHNKVPNIPDIITTGPDWIEIKPRGVSIHSLIPYSSFNDVLNTIKSAHRAGFIHRDIRHSNLILKDIKSTSIILIDWAYAVKVDSSCIYSGTLYTASDRILDHLSKNKSAPIKMKFSDDLESLVKTIILIKEPGIEDYLKQKNRENITGIIDAWKSAPISSFSKKLLSYAQKENYDKLIKKLS